MATAPFCCKVQTIVEDHAMILMALQEEASTLDCHLLAVGAVVVVAAEMVSGVSVVAFSVSSLAQRTSFGVFQQPPRS